MQAGALYLSIYEIANLQAARVAVQKILRHALERFKHPIQTHSSS